MKTSCVLVEGSKDGLGDGYDDDNGIEGVKYLFDLRGSIKKENLI